MYKEEIKSGWFRVGVGNAGCCVPPEAKSLRIIKDSLHKHTSVLMTVCAFFASHLCATVGCSGKDGRHKMCNRNCYVGFAIFEINNGLDL